MQVNLILDIVEEDFKLYLVKCIFKCSKYKRNNHTLESQKTLENVVYFFGNPNYVKREK